MKRIIAGLAVALSFFAYPAPAAEEIEDPESEIVYRTNLGRAADVRLLIDNGVSVHTVNSKGIPLLALAASRKDREGINVVTALIEKGANINALDTNGQTPLFYAAKQGNKDIAQLLLEKGADYYIIDNKGDIARNLAHREGHTHIVEAMDKFVREQTEKVRQQYLNANTELKKAYDEAAQRQEERIKQIGDAAKEQEEEAKDELLEALEQQEELHKQLLAKRESPEFREALHEFSFSNCAYQYWHFLRNTKQTIKLTPTELDIAIDSHKERIKIMTKQLEEEYKLESSWVNRVATEGKLKIFNQLNIMPSKSYRFEHGVGRMEDMQTRCETIAKTWDEPLDSHEIKTPPKRRGGGGLEGGGSSPLMISPSTIKPKSNRIKK